MLIPEARYIGTGILLRPHPLASLLLQATANSAKNLPT